MLAIHTIITVVQRIAVAISCAIFLYMMPMEDGFHKSFLLACVTFLACVEKLSSTMNAISVGRDWVGESFMGQVALC